jgi:predicted protein tyrosine phosphatase
MPRIHVCPLSRLSHCARETGAQTLVTLINRDTPVVRPPAIAADRHLFVAVSDITEHAEGHILPADAHVEAFLAFMRAWDRAAPVLIHCYAGVSRSTAAAFIAVCALDAERSEAEIAQALRRASPTATPNARLVALADATLKRDGRMVAAIAAIGRGRSCFEGVPFGLEVPAA